MAIVMAIIALIDRHGKTVTVLLYAAAFSCGAYLLSSKIDSLTDEVGEKCDRVTVTSSPRLSPSGKVYFMDAETRNGTLLQLSVLLDTAKSSSSVPDVGDDLSLDENIQPVEPSQWNISHGYGGRLFLLPGKWKIMSEKDHSLSFRDRFYYVRKSLISNFHRAEIDTDEYAILSAMTLGDKSFISKDLKEAYSKTGASHVLALSGMHLAVIFSIVMFVLSHLIFGVDRLLYRYFLNQKVTEFTNRVLALRPEPFVYSNIAAILCCVFIWMYVLLVGAMPSVVRAASMLTVYSLLRLFNRQGRGLNVLCITAFIMLLVSPLSLFDVGFQMSFLAVLGITLFYSKISGLYTIEFYEKGVKRILKWLWNGISLAFSAQLFVLPLIAFYFERIAVCAIILSPVISFMAVILVGGSMFFLFVSVLAHSAFMPSIIVSWSAYALSFLASCQNRMLQWLSSLPFSYIDGVRISLPQLVLVYIILVSTIIIILKITKK